MKNLRILFIEPFFGGSHRNFAEGLIRHSSHSIELFTLPARYWKWRMRGAALHFFRLIDNPEDYDLLFTSDMMSLSDLRMLWGVRCPPSVVYFHENQLSYPLPEGEKMDYQFGFTDITTALAADRLLFNSEFHMNSFFSDIPRFIKRMPEYKPLWVSDIIREKSSVMYPGCSFPDESTAAPQKPPAWSDSPAPPLILWNHRWEFDKCPGVFFGSLDIADRLLKTDGYDIPFNIAVLGENFQAKPSAFLEAHERYGDRILRFGYCENREEYYSWLMSSDIVISTAIQENFGISIVEAVQSGCFPLLPDRLSYPELVPEDFRQQVIYKSEKDLASKLSALLKKLHNGEKIKSGILAESFERFSWRNMIGAYDAFFAETAGLNY